MKAKHTNLLIVAAISLALAVEFAAIWSSGVIA